MVATQDKQNKPHKTKIGLRPAGQYAHRTLPKMMEQGISSGGSGTAVVVRLYGAHRSVHPCARKNIGTTTRTRHCCHHGQSFV